MTAYFYIMTAFVGFGALAAVSDTISFIIGRVNWL